ncbi:MAG: hypothetical protein JW937_07480 [Candidatus Omnitrophica bacterium]|nr:hypothetical protein [Candidatus Omnitrophota bacterium]
MTPHEAAKIYIDLVQLEESLPPDELHARQEISALRSKYHDLFSDELRRAGIPFADRFDATRKAYSLAEDSQ